MAISQIVAGILLRNGLDDSGQTVNEPIINKTTRSGLLKKPTSHFGINDSALALV